MKQFSLIFFAFPFLLFSCNKNIYDDNFQTNSGNKINFITDTIKKVANLSLNESQLNSYDWTKPICFKLKNDSLIFIIKNKVTEGEFLIVQNTEKGYDLNKIEIIKSNNYLTILNESVKNKNKVEKLFLNGKFVDTDKLNIKSNSVEKTKSNFIGGNTLPEVVVTGYLNNNTFTDFYSLYWLFNQNPLYYNVYIPITASYSSSGPTYIIDYQIAYEIEFDDRLTRNNVNIQKLKNCFDQISSTGATYKLDLCTDIPINTRPDYNLLVSKPGHAFLQITKSNQNTSITRSFGFYPDAQNFNTLLDQVNSVIKEDNSHEFNAKISMDLNESQFQYFMNYSYNLSILKNQYNIQSYNCVNYALDCFNSVRNSAYKINADYVSITDLFNGKTPSSLYRRLESMKNNNFNGEANNISIGTSSSSISSGQCN
jgi:hypothetical protein